MLIPFLIRHAQRRLAGIDRGAVDQRVDAAQLFGHGVEGGLAGGGSADVGLGRGSLHALGGQRRKNLRRVGKVDDPDALGPGLDGHFGNQRAKAHGPADDDNVEILHFVLISER